MESGTTKIPQHIAIIMDGNGRWAKDRGLTRLQGHAAGTQVSEDIINGALDLGIKYLTLYAFSSENWERPIDEVEGLMDLLNEFLISRKQKMLKNGIRLNTIGNISLLPKNVQETLADVMSVTAHNDKLVLTLALSYGSRDEIVRAINKLMVNKKQVNEEDFGQALDTSSIPDPDLIIRTSGEYRISNFLLWQGAYAEYVFEPVNWPDFTVKHLEGAIKEYQKRERRFGRTSEQLIS